MIHKKIKEYSNRQRIDLNKKDGFDAGADVVIMTAKEYEDIKTKLFEYNAMDKELEILKNQEQNLKEILADAIAPIDDHYKKELSKKDKEIKQLQVQLKAMQDKTNQYNLDMQGLNAFDLLIFRKHKKLIKSYNEDIAIIGVDPKIIDADAKAIPGADDSQK